MPYHTKGKKNAGSKSKDLTARQKEMWKKHSAHHTKKHIALMKHGMKEGKTFTQAHKYAMSKVGK